MNCSAKTTRVDEPCVQTDRREHPRQDIPAAAVVVGQPGEAPQVLTTRILNLSQSGANIYSETPIDDDQIWLAFTQEERLIVEAVIVWTDAITGTDSEFVYGVRFTRLLEEQEFVEVMNSLGRQSADEQKLKLTLRQREESLYSLFRGHSPRGARSVCST